MALPVDAPTRTPESLRILVAEDDVGTPEGVGTILKRGGYAVTTARDGKSAQAALAPPPSVAIVDSRLPDMDGLDLLASLRAAAPDLPVILVMHWPNPALYAEAMQRGAAACLSRPFSLWEFWVILQQILRAAWNPGAPPWQPRRALRTSMGLPLTARPQGSKQRWRGRLRDLSHTGAMLVLSAQVEAGQTLLIALGPPAHAVRLRASVLWNREDALHPGVYLHGVRFSEPQALAFALDLARWDASLAEAGGEPDAAGAAPRRKGRTRGSRRARAAPGGRDAITQTK